MAATDETTVIVVVRNRLLMSLVNVLLIPFALPFAMVSIKVVMPIMWLMSPLTRRLPPSCSKWVEWSGLWLAGMILCVVPAWIVISQGVNWDIVLTLSGVCVFLCAVGTLGAVWDQIRYRGWTTESSDSLSRPAVRFVNAIMNCDTQSTLEQTTNRYQSSCDRAKHIMRIQDIREALGVAPKTTSFDRPPNMPLEHLPELISFLQNEVESGADGFAFALLQCPGSSDKHWLMMHMRDEGGVPAVDSFELLTERAGAKS